MAGVPYPLAEALRTNFKEDFKSVSLFSWANSILLYNDKSISQDGLYVEPNAPAMLDLKMLQGNLSALQDPDAILLSQSATKAIFGNTNPVNQFIKVENEPAKVTGVY